MPCSHTQPTIIIFHSYQLWYIDIRVLQLLDQLRQGIWHWGRGRGRGCDCWHGLLVLLLHDRQRCVCAGVGQTRCRPGAA